MSERRTLLLYSTSHVSLADSELLERHAKDASGILDWPSTNSCFIAGFTYGWLLWVGTEGLDHDADNEFAAAGFSPAVPAILRHAHARGAEYVMLDCDSWEDDDLPTYEWKEEKRARHADAPTSSAPPVIPAPMNRD